MGGLSRNVAAIALALLYFRLRFGTSVRGQRPAGLNFFLKLAAFVAADKAPVAFVRSNDSAFARFRFFCCHI